MSLTEREEDEPKRLQLNDFRRGRRGRALIRSAVGAAMMVGAAYLFKPQKAAFAAPYLIEFGLFMAAGLISVRCARDCWNWGHNKGGVVAGALAFLVAVPFLFASSMLFLLALAGQLQPERPIVFLFAWGGLLFWVALRIYDHLRFRRARAAALRQE